MFENDATKEKAELMLSMTVEISQSICWMSASGKGVEGELRDAIEEAQLDDWQTQWQPALIEVLQELRAKACRSRSGRKAGIGIGEQKTARVQGLLAFPGFSVVCTRETQGLTQVDLTKALRESQPARQAAGLSRLSRSCAMERPDLGQLRRVCKASVRLSSTAAIALSEAGRFQGETRTFIPCPRRTRFIATMRDDRTSGLDEAYQNLRYFEMTCGQARRSSKRRTNMKLSEARNGG